MAYFQMQKSDRPLTIFTTHSTTISPQKHHAFPHIFCKNPCKTPSPPQQEKGRTKQKKAARQKAEPLSFIRESTYRSAVALTYADA
jgi:hypothetical protein